MHKGNDFFNEHAVSLLFKQFILLCKKVSLMQKNRLLKAGFWTVIKNLGMIERRSKTLQGGKLDGN